MKKLNKMDSLKMMSKSFILLKKRKTKMIFNKKRKNGSLIHNMRSKIIF